MFFKRTVRVYCQQCGYPQNVRRSSLGTVQRCRTCGARGEVDRRAGVPHLLHFGMTVITFGLWLPVWVFHYLWARG